VTTGKSTGDPPRTPAPTIEVVGLGPGGPDLLTRDAAERLASASHLFLRTSRHPAAADFSDARSFDLHYERCPTFEEVYDAIVGDLLAEARRHGHVVYAVPGSPSVAERTVDLLRCHPAVQSSEVTLVVFPALSFLELAFERLEIDPVATGVRIVDGSSFALEAAGSFGPLIVAQCWDRSVLSAIKLAPETPPTQPATVLFHLGLPDEKVWEVAWDDLDRSFDPDHLTSLWVPELEAPVGGELVKLEELVRTLRERCPWDRRQTHGSLRRHLLEETYEVLEVLDQLAATETGAQPGVDARAQAAHPSVAALEEELGDLLFQIYFHARLAAEAGHFTLADVARGIHDKLVDRHPHVFGTDEATTAEGAPTNWQDMATNWELGKLAEKKRSSVTEGIPSAMPALALAAKLQRKALAVGMVLPALADEAERVADDVAALTALRVGDGPEAAGPADGAVTGSSQDAVGEVLFALVSVARELGVDPEAALRTRLASFRTEVEAIG
jgi:tetrapyrrole methylase family protein/MazG family protein